MSRQEPIRRDTADRCLTAEELSRYVAGIPRAEGAGVMEKHLASCSRCREELAEVLELLHPEPGTTGEEEAGLSAMEITRAAAWIRDVARKEGREKPSLPWRRWITAAAAALVFFVAGAAGFQYWYGGRQLEQGFAEAKAELEKDYAPSSLNGLRLDLPFASTATQRGQEGGPSLAGAESLFSHLLNRRPSMTEARMGLATVYLRESRFSEAHAEFGKILDTAPKNVQALIGRGVAGFEQSIISRDPMEQRTLLRGALDDFDAALKLSPDSLEARYDRIRALYETGEHEEALSGIQDYLSHDPDSIWAARLRALQVKIGIDKPGAMETELKRASRLRDRPALSLLAHQVPERVPAAILNALLDSLQVGGNPAGPGSPGAEDLRWGAEVLEQEYSAENGDISWRKLLDFYAGLSSPQRRSKQSLDARFNQLMSEFQNNGIASALSGSVSLISGYSILHDSWQLVRTRHLRGNSYFWLADFKRAETEYLEMKRLAEVTGAPELVARALGGLATVYNEEMRPEDALVCLEELSQLAEHYRLPRWTGYAAQAAGTIHRQLNELEESLTDYCTALRIAYRRHDNEALAGILEKLLPVMVRRGRLQDARTLGAEAESMMSAYEEELGRSRKIEVAASRTTLLWRRGELALVLQDYDQAQALFARALADAPETMRELVCKVRLGLAQVELAKGHQTAAMSILEEVVATTAAAEYLEDEWRARFLLGRACRERGDTTAALEELQRSVAILDRMRIRIHSVDSRQQFLDLRYDPYKELVSLYVHDLHDFRKAAEFAARAKSMTLNEYLDARNSLRSGEAQTNLASLRATAIDYFFTEKELLAFVSEPSGNRVITIPVSVAEAEREVEAFLDCIPREDSGAFDSLSRRLYDQIVRPVLQSMETDGGSMLVVYPDGPLHRLPFGGLQDSRGRYLLETHTLSYAPSPGVLAHCIALGRGDASSHDRTILLVGGNDNLQGADNELAQLSKIYDSRARFLGVGDRESPGRLAAEAEILHFAGHARQVKGSPVLVLTSGPTSSQLNSREIGTWHMDKVRLVTLAGCSTGIGPQANGETPWGLIPAFLNAGAPALVVSLFPVDDAATERLTYLFYRTLSAGSVSKASALQQAQRALLDEARAAGRVDPASWLPFVLIGDPR